MARAKFPGTTVVRDIVARSFLRDVPPPVANRLIRDAVVHNARAGEVFIVQSEGQRCAIVLTGLVRVFVALDTGQERTLREVTPGGAVGIAAFSGQPSIINAEAIVDSDLLEIDPERLSRHASQEPALAMALLREVSARLRDTEQVMTAEFGPIPQRLARKLLDSAAETRDEPAVARVSHAELGAQLGASREWITKVLADLQRQGLIELAGRRRIRVTDPHRLLAMARAWHTLTGPELADGVANVK